MLNFLCKQFSITSIFRGVNRPSSLLPKKSFISSHIPRGIIFQFHSFSVEISYLLHLNHFDLALTKISVYFIFNCYKFLRHSSFIYLPQRMTMRSAAAEVKNRYTKRLVGIRLWTRREH